MVLETTVDGWEKFGSVASGGRYDNLTRLFTDQALPGVGASIGLDRLLALFDEAGLLKGPATSVPVLVVDFRGGRPRGDDPPRGPLRAAGIGAEVYPDPIQIGKQLQYGSTRGHRFAVIVGPDETSERAVQPARPGHAGRAQGLPAGCLEATLPRTRPGNDRGGPMRPDQLAKRRSPSSRGPGTDRPPTSLRLARLEATILDCFARAGYDRLATPVLEPVELHERKSGAGIVAKLFSVDGSASRGSASDPN